jgi:hypothetical protein
MKSTSELRSFLVSQMEGVANGDIGADVAKGVTNIAQQIYNTLLIEVKMAKARADLGEDAITPVRFDD